MTISESKAVLGIARGAYKALASLPMSDEREYLVEALSDLCMMARGSLVGVAHAENTQRLFESAGN